MTTRKIAGATVVLLALLLVAVPMVFAQGGTTTQTVTNTLQTGITPSVTVSDQSIKDGTVTIDKVVSDGPGWIAIHIDVNGQDGAVIGYAPVNSGENTKVAVQIDAAKATPTLHAMLHTDAGTVGKYEFPGPDVPVIINGVMVDPTFQVTGLAATPVMTATATTTATATLVPTVAASPTATATVGVSNTSTPSVSATGTPVTLPTTGGSPMPWSLVVMALGGLILVGGLGLALARRS